MKSPKNEFSSPSVIEVLEEFNDDGDDGPMASVMVFNAND
jgi:hypothetical protein